MSSCLFAVATIAGLWLVLGDPTGWFGLRDGVSWQSVWHWQFAWPRALLAALIGSGLGAAGWICQRLARNPLASPALLGIPAAAGTAVMVAILLAGDTVLQSYTLPGAAMTGGLLGAALLWLAAERRFAWHGTRLLLVGVAIGGVFAAVTFALALFTEPVVYRFATGWLAGSLATATWNDVVLIHWPWALLLLLSLLATRPMLVLGFDDDSSASLGVCPRRWRRRAFVLAALLTSLCVTGGGAFAFVGFAAPHLARRLGGTAADRPGSAALAGAAMLLLADGLCRRELIGFELPTGVAVAALCVPWLLVEVARPREANA